MRLDRRLLITVSLLAGGCASHEASTTVARGPLAAGALGAFRSIAGAAAALRTPPVLPTLEGMGRRLPTKRDADRCPAYADAALRRPRMSGVDVGPEDDWQGAIREASPGSEVRLRDGEYRLDKDVVIGARVTVRGRSGHRSRVLLRGPGRLVAAGRDVTLTGFSMTGAAGPAITAEADGLHVYDVHLFDGADALVKAGPAPTEGGLVACSSLGRSPGVRGGDVAVDLTAASGWVVRDDDFYHLPGDAVRASGGSRDTVVERSVFSDNGRAVALGPDHEGGVVRNVFVARSRPGGEGIALDGADGALVAHNTVRLGGDPRTVTVRASAGVRVFNNLLSARVRDLGDGEYTSRGNIADADDADFDGSEDFHLRRGSRALGAARALAEVTDDLDGDARGPARDVGCDQRSGVVDEPPPPPVDEPPPPPPPVEEPPPVDEPDVASFCPPYVDSPLFRRRDRQVVVGPNDDWKGAIGSARPGTEVLLRDGTYELGNTYGLRIHDGVTVRGQRGDRSAVVIRGRGYGPEAEALTIDGADSTIADLSITQVRNHAITLKGSEGAQAPHIYNVHLFDIGTQHIKGTPGGTANGVIACSSIGYSPGAVRGDYIDAIDLHGAIDWVIRDNYIYNITGEHNGCEVESNCGTYDSGPAILVWNQARGTIVERNVIVDSFRGIALGLDRGHEGGIVRNNFFYRAGGGDVGLELRTANNVLVAHNTVIAGGLDYAMHVSRGVGHRILNNLFSGTIQNRGNVEFSQRGNLFDARDADFARAGDVHLRPGSRAVGAGVPVDGVPEDVDGEPRAAARDVGADQVGR